MVLTQLLSPTPGAAGSDAMTPLAETRRELADRFNGVTAYVRSPAKGLWTAPDGHTEANDVVIVEVVTDNVDRAWWRNYAAALARRFGQGRIHVRALPVDMRDEGDLLASTCMPRSFSRSTSEARRPLRTVEGLADAVASMV